MAEKTPEKEIFWKCTLGAIITLFAVATIASVMVAKRKVSRVVDADYYTHGLHYGEGSKPVQQSAKGWNMTTSMTGGLLQVMVRDRDGNPVTGGMLSFNLETGAAGEGHSLVLKESGPGNYSASQPENAGQLRGVMRFVKGEAAVTGKVVFLN